MRAHVRVAHHFERPADDALALGIEGIAEIDLETAQIVAAAALLELRERRDHPGRSSLDSPLIRRHAVVLAQRQEVDLAAARPPFASRFTSAISSTISST